jgi:hypothetical protein
LLLGALLGCSGVSSDPGTAARMQLANAEFTPGALPGESGGPSVVAINVSSFTVSAGSVERPLLGTLAAGSTAIGVQLDGDRGWWLLVAGVPDSDSPTLPSFNTRMSFARGLSPGPIFLVARAIDEAGRFGPASRLPLTVAAEPEGGGRLAISLAWASASDLDLHVLEPGGAEIWSDAPASPSGGTLDLDSNSQCVVDGHNGESVRYAMPPPGHYLVRVDTFSLCGLASAAWRVQVTLDGAPLASAEGTSVEADSYGRHQRGSGREALGFDVP